MRGAVPDRSHLRIYLDSNVLFSASYIASSPYRNFWKLTQVTPVTSLYAVGEVIRHNVISSQRERFDELIARTERVSDADLGFVPQSIRLVEKDRPILAAAIAASADYLVTGDKSHFAHRYSTRVSGVCVIHPTDFLARQEDRLPD